VKTTFACVGALALAVAYGGVAVPAPVPPLPKETPQTELAKLAGKWKIVSRVQAGEEAVAGKDRLPEAILVFGKEGGFRWGNSTSDSGKIVRMDPTKNPKEIDYEFGGPVGEGTRKGVIQKGLYKFDGNKFIDCCSKPGGERPTEFKSTPENGYEIMTAQRVQEKD